MINKNPTIEDVYNFDYYISTPGVREGLMQQSEISGEEFSVEDTDDGQAVYFNTPYGEQVPVGRPVLLAAGPAQTVTDANPYDLPMEAQNMPGVSPGQFVRGLADTAALGAKGATQAFIGLSGDIISLARGAFDFAKSGGEFDAFVAGLSKPTGMPTTEDAKKFFDRVAPLGPDKMLSDVYRNNPEDAKLVEGIGEFAAPGGYIKGAKTAVQGVKAAGSALGPVAADMAGDLLQRQGLILNAAPPGPGVVSTRLPTAVKATEDPMASKLVIDLQATKRDPEAFNHNVGLIKQYPNFASKARNPERQAEDFIEGVKDNLIFLHDQVPDATRQRSKLWYDGARNITDKFAGEYNVPDQAVAGVMAVLSPQKDWFMNVSLGQRVLDIMSKQQSARWDSSMDQMAKVIWKKPQYAPMVDAIRGKTLAEIQDPGLKAMWLRTFDQAKNPREHQIVSPEGDFVGVRKNQDGKTPTKTGWGSLNEIGKAVVIFQDPSIETISRNLGEQHKVRNFYNNIYAPGDPAGHVTIDTHAVAAGLLRPLSGESREVKHNFGSNVKGEVGPKNSSITGVQGTYGLYAEAYRRAAQERGILPREMQSITWEAVRGLYPDTFKSQAKNVEQIDNIWLQYRKGKLSLDEARNEVLRAAGGINAPEWEQSGLRSGLAQEIQPGVDPRELSGSGVPRGSARGSGRVQPATGNPATVNRGRQAPNQGAN
jgi:hypothetical protein